MAMTDKNSVTPPAAKDPSDWVTGDEPATGAQLSYVQTLATDSGRTRVETNSPRNCPNTAVSVQSRKFLGAKRMAG